MLSVLGFIAILAPLVVFHEFGHYIFARLFRVKAEVFSVGFGPRLWSRQWGETEVRISAIPLGGYVKLLGEEPGIELSDEDKKRALHKQAAWKRFLIFFGGPFFNFILAILIFMVILLIGEPQVGTRIARVAPGSDAEQAGFQVGDRITAVEGAPVRFYNQIALTINETVGKPLRFEVERGVPPVKMELVATPQPESGYSIYGEEKEVGAIHGLSPSPRAMLAGVSDPKSPAWIAGIRTGDWILSANSSAITNWESFEVLYSALPAGGVFVLEVGPQAGPARATVQFTKSKPGSSMADEWGLHSAELFVEELVEGAPAQTAGILAQDRLVSVGGKAVNSFSELRSEIQAQSEAQGKIALIWESAGEMKQISIVPQGRLIRDPSLRQKTEYTIGVKPFVAFADPEMLIERVWNPFILAYRGTEKMLIFSWRNLVSIGKMFSGDVSIKTLGGPILIGKIAGDSLERGLISFLNMMAILSVGLGILNVLPIPVLDGGHLLLLMIEVIRGKPLSIQQMELVQQVGLTLILVLMAIVMKNDLTRLPLFN